MMEVGAFTDHPSRVVGFSRETSAWMDRASIMRSSMDIFRSRDMSGLTKALWLLLVIVTVINTAIAVYYYLSVVREACFREPGDLPRIIRIRTAALTMA